jgi:preprotein translocase subunit SecG
LENVVLTIHLILAMGLIGVVLLQRSEGGGLGMGGGGGAMTGRAAATALAKVTWILAAAFICTSITLTIFAARNSAGTSVVDQFGGTDLAPEKADPAAPLGTDLLPPGPSDAPAAPPAPAAPAPATNP